MIRRSVGVIATSALLFSLAPLTGSANAAPTDPAQPGEAAAPSSEQGFTGAKAEKGTVMSLGAPGKAETYIVQLDQPAVPSRETADGARAQDAPSASGYRAELVEEQADLRSSIRRITGAAPRVTHTYTEAANGLAVRLTRAQARQVADLDGVAAVHVDEERQLQTDVGPEWIGAPGIWDGTDTPAGVEGSKGEGVIVGILDSGLNPANPSFHDVGADGYDHTNPWGAGTYVGMCDPTSSVFVADWGCNDKLIGYWNLTTDGSRYDDDGHGTHTGSTTAGNVVDATTYAGEGTEFEFSTTERIKGVAPHANVIGYDVCDGGCPMSAILAGIDQAITDGVDVINYSIGSAAPSDPWSDPDAIGFLNARAAGIHVATSAGNAGPGAETLGSPGDVPWITTVGATQHNRQWQAAVTDLTAQGGATHPDIEGVAFAKASDGAFPVVDVTTLGDPLCTAAGLGNVDLTGKIVLCTRGGNGRVEKGGVVAGLGAEGMILANDQASGDSLNADPHELPAVHITYADAQELRTWLASVTNPQAELSGGQRYVGDDVADIMAAFSSRGPNRAVSMISPSVSAPGVDILAADGADNEVSWGFISGTSMASPHTAGALALLKGVQPDWTPAEAQSALMTTAVTEIKDNDGTDADWHDMGSGRVDLTKAAKAGFVLDESAADYLAADPAEGGDVRALNIASMADNECLSNCEWTRTLTGTATGAGTWTVSTESFSPELTVSVAQESLALTAGGEANLTVTAELASSAGTDTWLYGTVVLTPPAGSSAPEAHLPVAVLPSSGVLPSSIDITTRRDAGSQVTDGLQAIELDSLKVTASGLVPESTQSISVPEDQTNTDPYNGDGTTVVRVDVPQGATRLLTSLRETTAPDFDMFVGRGEVSAANEVCSSASGGSAERCEVANPEAGSWWILVQNWEATTAGGSDTAVVATAVVAGDAGNLRAEGPTGPIEAGTPFSIRTFWDEDAMEAGQTWYGSLTLGAAPGTDGHVGVVPVTVRRVEDDVTRTADVERAAPGETITYTVDIAPNVSQEDLTYTLTETLPEGTTYVEGSATGGATYADGKVTWEGELESTFGDVGGYEATTSVNDPSCVHPYSGEQEYFDLASAGLRPSATVTGNDSAFTAFSDVTFGFYGKQYQGLTFTDDGYLVYDHAANWSGATAPGTPQTLPDVEKPNNLAAALWRDMAVRYDAAAGSGVTLASTGSLRFVEYDDMRAVDGTGGSLDLQVVAQVGSNDLVFAYDNVTGDLGNVTVGTENATGTDATTLINNAPAAGTIRNDLLVCMTYAVPQAEGASFAYQVTVDPDVVNRDVLTSTLVHTTSDPGAKPVTDTVGVEVKGAKERSSTALAVSPSQITTGGTLEATATVVAPVAAKPTGTVEFLVNGAKAGEGTLDANGSVRAKLTAPAQAGTYPVVARYLGDAGTHGSTSAPTNVVVTAPGQQPPAKVKASIGIKTPKQVKVRSKATKQVKVEVDAPGVTPTGKVAVVVKGAGRTKTYRVTLSAAGKAKVKLPRYRRAGKVTVTVTYRGDAAVESATARKTFQVKNKKR